MTAVANGLASGAGAEKLALEFVAQVGESSEETLGRGKVLEPLQFIRNQLSIGAGHVHALTITSEFYYANHKQ
ncbi:hypothetical protein FHL15_001475 [Xylaria flabelliformis]|uniref:Uncharacterized protein n=1 Tax=Xylaria flabelliformis TaxID=2512241 RepID=A0A553IBZ0_9PEZI|nr:hypothetical protein FHL15_001475 [Xylaria flabelliformis]